MRKLQLILAVAVGGTLLSTSASASTVISDPNADDNRIICKKLLETGSLVKRNKQCFTKAEWARIADSQRNGAERLVHDLASKKGDNN